MSTPKKKAVKQVKSVKAVKAVNKASVEPLSDAEYCELEKLIVLATENFRNVWESSRAVDKARNQLALAEDALRISRNENAAIHREIAPLYHRLPVV